MIINDFKTEFDIGDVVYEVVDPDQNKMIMVGFVVMKFGVKYICTSHVNESQYFDFELTKDKTL